MNLSMGLYLRQKCLMKIIHFLIIKKSYEIASCNFVTLKAKELANPDIFLYI